MSKVHWYVKCGNTIPIFELGSNSFHISVDTPIPDWDDYYNQGKQLEFNRYRVKDGKTTNWISFSSLSSATSFLYGKPCDIKTTIRFSRELTDDEDDLLIFYYLLNRVSVYESGESFTDVLWKSSINENTIKEDYMKLQSKDLEGLGIEDKICAGAALLTRGITEMSARAFAKEFAEVLKPLSSTSDDELTQKTFVPVFTDASHSDSLDMENANACIRSIKRNLIPVLVGEAGCGKTYTAEHLGEKLLETFGKEGQVLKQTKICCSGIPYNEFWGSYDAVSHMCTGSFKYIWKEAENNSDILYYVILDEMLDMTDIRQTFGGAFANLDELPNNLFIVATGNNGVWEAGGVTYNKMLNDNGIDQNRFNLIPVHNIFEDLNSAEAQLYLSSFDKDSERFKDIMEVATSDISKVLSPRKFRNMMQLSDEEYKEDIEFGNKRDKHYKEKALLVDRPKYEK